MTFPPSVQSLLDTADDFDDMLQSIGFRKVFSVPERADPLLIAPEGPDFRPHVIRPTNSRQEEE